MLLVAKIKIKIELKIEFKIKIKIKLIFYQILLASPGFDNFSIFLSLRSFAQENKNS